MKRPYRLLLCGLVLGAIVAFVVIIPTVSRSVAETAPAAPGETTATGDIGGFPEGITDVALTVEDSGRVHVLWTGKLNPNFNDWTLYSTSVDGST